MALRLGSAKVTRLSTRYDIASVAQLSALLTRFQTGKGVVGFLRALLGFEQEIMREGGRLFTFRVCEIELTVCSGRATFRCRNQCIQ
jgi:hypothetical protein